MTKLIKLDRILTQDDIGKKVKLRNGDDGEVSGFRTNIWGAVYGDFVNIYVASRGIVYVKYNDQVERDEDCADIIEIEE